MSYISLESYYKIKFAIQQFHHWDLENFENSIPWERDALLGLLEEHIEEENLKAQQNA
jgi:hypothetical protein